MRRVSPGPVDENLNAMGIRKLLFKVTYSGDQPLPEFIEEGIEIFLKVDIRLLDQHFIQKYSGFFQHRNPVASFCVRSHPPEGQILEPLRMSAITQVIQPAREGMADDA